MIQYFFTLLLTVAYFIMTLFGFGFSGYFALDEMESENTVRLKLLGYFFCVAIFLTLFVAGFIWIFTGGWSFLTAAR